LITDTENESHLPEETALNGGHDTKAETMPLHIDKEILPLAGTNDNGAAKEPAAKKTSKKPAAQTTKKPAAPAKKAAAHAKKAPAKKAAAKKSSPEKRKIKKAVADIPVPEKKAELVAVKVTLNLRFHTKVGQSLFITGGHPVFGDNDIDKALPMHYRDNENWTADIVFEGEHFPKQPIPYNYFLKNDDGSISYDWGKDKTLNFKNNKASEILIIDAWNHAGYFENAFYTKAFKNVLLKSTTTTLQSHLPKTYTHTFRVKAPLLGKNQTLCMLGNTDILGDWNGSDAVLMGKAAGEEYYTAKLNLEKVAFPLVYKYGVYDTEKQQFLGFENVNNHVLYDMTAKNKQTIVNDGFAVLPNTSWKGAGVAIPVFSLRSNNSFGVGEFNDLKLFADWAKKTGLKLIQILPVNDTTASKTWMDSYPYGAISAFALHPMYLHLEDVVNEENKHFLDAVKDEKTRLNALDSMDYEAVNNIKWKIIRQIYPSQKEAVFASKDYKQFFENNQHWLVAYAVFCYLRDKNNTADFSFWRTHKEYKDKEIDKLLADEAAANEIAIHFFVQYHLHVQLQAAAAYAHENNVVIKGDIPIGIGRNSADAWQQPHLFHMALQAGAPPDAFTVKGQNWGFPTYNWAAMREDGFAWWKQRFAQMYYYFDAFRIDHILGFFRIWSIPISDTEGIMGHFDPAIPVHINEFHERRIWFDYARYCKPYITEGILQQLFGQRKEEAKNIFLYLTYYKQYEVKPEFNTQQKVVHYFNNLRDENQIGLKEGMLSLLSNVILFEAEGSNGQQFHFRFGMDGTSSFQHLEYGTQLQLRALYINYYFRRQDGFWEKEAMQKLPALKRGTDMLVCGEDLGLVPACVPGVMKQLGILSLEIQRMPKDPKREFFHPNDAPYLSVVTPSTHDMSTIRTWWEEDRAKTQRFYNNELGQWGTAPFFCEDWINKAIVLQHLYSTAMWSIFQLQDLLGIDKQIRRNNPHDERINQPADPKHYWKYRMHLTLEDLLAADAYNEELKKNIEACGRG
jgi:4-alpha-glucanotransferase